MNQLFRITDNEIHIDSLTLEATIDCAKNCGGCYLKAHRLQGPVVNWSDWLSLLDTFMLKDITGYSCNQISISINEKQNDVSFKTISAFLYYLNFLKPEERTDTKVHLTMFSPSTIKQYIFPYLDLDMAIKLFSNVDSIYFSNILTDEDLDVINALRAQNKNLKIGWNATAGISISKRNILEDSRFNGIYQVINKSESKPIFSFAGEPKKIQQDVCLTDYNNWKQTGKPTCPANISKFTIWPDGSVSGCPYAKTSNTGPAQTVNGILANIVEASKFYDFDRCPMKGLY